MRDATPTETPKGEENMKVIATIQMPNPSYVIEITKVEDLIPGKIISVDYRTKARLLWEV